MRNFGAFVIWFVLLGCESEHHPAYFEFTSASSDQRNHEEFSYVNLLSVDILMMGESYHNNHHKFPGSVNFGKRWHEVDPTYPIILMLKWLGIIKLAKPALVNASGGHDHDPDF